MLATKLGQWPTVAAHAGSAKKPSGKRTEPASAMRRAPSVLTCGASAMLRTPETRPALTTVGGIADIEKSDAT